MLSRTVLPPCKRLPKLFVRREPCGFSGELSLSRRSRPVPARRTAFINRSSFLYGMAFCPVCGKNIRQGESFCDDHKPSRLEVKPFDVRLCSCGRLFAHNHWFHPQDLESSVVKVVKDHVKQKVPIRLEYLDAPEKRGNKGYGRAVATVQGEEVPLDFPV